MRIIYKHKTYRSDSIRSFLYCIGIIKSYRAHNTGFIKCNVAAEIKNGSRSIGLSLLITPRQNAMLKAARAGVGVYDLVSPVEAKIEISWRAHSISNVARAASRGPLLCGI